MKIVSVCDGIAGAYLALERAGIPVDEYYSYEIDKYAIDCANKNYPNIIQKGDMMDVDWKQYTDVDLLIGGFPCQPYSRAGREEAFNDERSKPFFECVKALKEMKPRYFLFENTPMKEETKNIISSYIGCKPVEINASLVSAQNRKRLYWTNIPIKKIKDRGILMESIVEDDALVDRDKAHAVIGSAGRTTWREYYLKNQGNMVYTAVEFSNIHGGWGEKKPRIHVGKSCTITTPAGGGHLPSFMIEGKEFSLEDIKKCTRMITPKECKRLQTYPDDYTAGFSKTQRYKMLGNSFCVNVVSEILRGMKND